tara:strand:+ start:670 stop:2634 length:1965 start_codon:yes stop_codon:yes gene_type:complete
MRIEVIFILLLFLPLVYAQEEYQNYQTINVNTQITSELNLDRGVSFLSSELSFFPRATEFQTITKKIHSHDVDEKKDSVNYEWKNLPEELTFGLDYDIKSEFNMGKIKSKIPFPIEVPNEYKKYLESTNIINSDDAIIKEQAKKIIGDEDDLYKVVYKLASWSKENINYSLETLTEELTQNSVWVLQNRKGVCDELTVLFISMLRSQGIPAKFVSGSSYTNIIPGFGNHAWSEVYFPGKGWVPFDVTYGQFGYVDATHIKMKESKNAKEPSIKYRWSPGEKNIDVQPLNISTNFISTNNPLPQHAIINIKTLKDKIKSGSYFPIEIEVENTQNFYLSTTLYLTKAPTQITNNVKPILLKPKEKKKFYWILNTPTDLEDRYIYTSKIKIIDFFESSSEISVEYANKYSYYSLEEAEEKVYQLELENRNPDSSVDLFCSPNKLKYYSYEDAILNCKITNNEQKSYSFDLCFNINCEKVIVNPSEEKEITFDLSLEIGNQEYHTKISGEEIMKNSYFDVNVIKEPELKIENLNYIETINYKNKGIIKFDLSTESPAKNLVINMNKQNLFNFDVYEGKENFELPFNGKYFYKKDVKLIMNYEDDNGRKYTKEQEIKINVTEVPFYIAMGYWWLTIFALIIFFSIYLRRNRIPKAPKKS